MNKPFQKAELARQFVLILEKMIDNLDAMTISGTPVVKRDDVKMLMHRLKDRFEREAQHEID